MRGVCKSYSDSGLAGASVAVSESEVLESYISLLPEGREYCPLRRYLGHTKSI